MRGARSIFVRFFVTGLVLTLWLALGAIVPILAHASTVCATGCDHSLIQDAIDAATAGDTIVVKAGTYSEAVNVNKSVTLQSEVTGEATITSSGAAPGSAVIFVNADNVTIEGFRIVLTDAHREEGDASPGSFGIEVPVTATRFNLVVKDNYVAAEGGTGAFGENGVRGVLVNAVIEGNEFRNWASAIFFRPSGTGNKALNNTVVACNTGVLNWSQGTLVEGNTFSLVNMGVDLAQTVSVGNSTGSVLRNNDLSETRIGVRVRGDNVGVVDARLNDWGAYEPNHIMTKVENTGTGNVVRVVPFIDSDGYPEPPLVRRFNPDGSGWTVTEFLGIQDAIDDSSTGPGTRIQLPSGTLVPVEGVVVGGEVEKHSRTPWRESVLLNKPGVRLCGQQLSRQSPCSVIGPKLVEVQGTGSSPATTITADDVVVEGLQISASDPLVQVNGAASAAVRKNSLIVQSDALNDHQGIWYTSASGGAVEENSIIGNVYPGSTAIRTLQSDGVAIANNTITDSRVGIYIADSTNISIDGNDVGVSPETPGFGGDTMGVSLFRGTGHEVAGNTVSGMGIGLNVLGATDVSITGGGVDQVLVGIQLGKSGDLQPVGTEITAVDLAGASETPLRLRGGTGEEFFQVSNVHVDARSNHWGRYDRDEISSSISNLGTGNTIDIACWLSSDQVTQDCPPVPSIESPAEGALLGDHDVPVEGSGAQPGGDVDVLSAADQSILASAVADEDGHWQTSLSGLAGGGHSILARSELVDSNGVMTRSVPSAARSFTVDLSVPDTTILSGPAATTTSASPSFTFTSSEAGSSFECKLDAAAFTPCTSPKSYSGLADGPHTFQVRAIDQAGNADSTPAIHTWSIEPDTTILSGPSGTVSSRSASFGFASTVGESSFECSLDGAAFQPCTSPATYSGLADGPHNFEVRATGPNGTLDTSPASQSWTVDFFPETTITSGPSGTVNATTAAFTFVSNSPGSTFECSLDGAAYSPCTSPQTYAGLAEGTHSFEVRATETSTGKVDASPAIRVWVVDVTAPDTTITSGPTGTVTSSSASFAFSSTEAGSFSCLLDEGSYSPCTSPKSYAGLVQGSHIFRVRATDQAGNTDSSPALRTWIVDTVVGPPQITFLRPINGLYIGNELVMEGTTRPIIVGPITVEARAVDGDGISSFRFEVNSVPVNSSQVTKTGDVWSFTYTPTSAGNRVISAIVVDGAGLVASKALSITAIPM